MVWNLNLLSRPRIVQYPAFQRFRRHYLAIQCCCNAINSNIIGIFHICREASAAANRLYDKLVINIILDGFMAQGEECPFLYVNYNIDTVYLEISYGHTILRRTVRQDCLKDMSRVEYLAILLKETPPIELTAHIFFQEIHQRCLGLKKLTFVDYWLCRTVEEYVNDVKFVEMQTPEEYAYDEPVRQVLDDRNAYVDIPSLGNLLPRIALATRLKELMETQNPWTDMRFAFVLLATRTQGSNYWMLRYPVFDISYAAGQFMNPVPYVGHPYNFPPQGKVIHHGEARRRLKFGNVNTFGASGYTLHDHMHTENIELPETGEAYLIDCRPESRSILTQGSICEHCRRRRWDPALGFRDVFWRP